MKPKTTKSMKSKSQKLKSTKRMKSKSPKPKTTKRMKPTKKSKKQSLTMIIKIAKFLAELAVAFFI